MALGKSIKMYLTIFVATTCMYMILYQYHISRQPMPQPDIIKVCCKIVSFPQGWQIAFPFLLTNQKQKSFLLHYELGYYDKKAYVEKKKQ